MFPDEKSVPLSKGGDSEILAKADLVSSNALETRGLKNMDSYQAVTSGRNQSTRPQDKGKEIPGDPGDLNIDDLHQHVSLSNQAMQRSPTKEAEESINLEADVLKL